MLVAIRDAVLRHARIGCFDFVRELGIGHADLLIDRDMVTTHFHNSDGKQYDLASARGLEAFKNDIADAGIAISTVTLGTEFDTRPQAEEVAWMVRAAQLASELGAPSVRIDSWLRDRKMAADEFSRRIVAAVKEAVAQTDGVDFGIENHGSHGNQPEFLVKLFSAVASDRFGMTLDTGNFYWAGHPLSRVYELLERFAPLAKSTHVKNISFPEEKREVQRPVGWEYLKYVCPIPDGDVDHSKVVSILSKAGYDRALNIEDESHVTMDWQRFSQVLKRDAQYLKSLVS
jgi:sugar phosphate isomerase/epimerase